MGKKSINSLKPAKKKDTTALANLAEQVIFTPTPRQRKVKAQFWSRFQPGPFVSSSSSLSLPIIQEVVNVPSMKEWWHLDGFVSWFMNKEEAREKLEYLYMKALDTAEDILDDPNAQASAKVNMIKVLGELANKFPSKYQEKFADDEINKMDEKQLVSYLERKGMVFKDEQVIEITEKSGRDDADDREEDSKAQSDRDSKS